MVKASERIQHIDYKKLSALVRAGESTMELLRQDQARGITRNIKTLKMLTEQDFERAFRQWDATPGVKAKMKGSIQQARQTYFRDMAPYQATTPSVSWATFPDSRSDYRQLIYDLQTSLFLERKAEQARKPVPQPKAPASPQPKKSGWFKKAIVGTALVALGFFAKDKLSNKKPLEQTKAPQQSVSVVQTTKKAVSTLKQTLGKSADNSVQVVNPQDVAFQQAVKVQVQSNILAAHQTKGTEIHAKNARLQADIAKSNRTVHREKIYQNVDTSQAVRDISRNVRDTTENANRAVRNATQVVEGTKEFFNAFGHHSKNPPPHHRPGHGPR